MWGSPRPIQEAGACAAVFYGNRGLHGNTSCLCRVSFQTQAEKMETKNIEVVVKLKKEKKTRSNDNIGDIFDNISFYSFMIDYSILMQCVDNL